MLRRAWHLAGRSLPGLPLAALLSAALLVAGCASLLGPTALPVVLPGDWAARRTTLQEWPRFELRGRVAVASGTEGFTAALRWAQRAEATRLEIDGPLGVGGLRLDFANGHLTDEIAHADLERRLGFKLPVESLRYWMLGVPDPARVADETLAAGGARLESLQQDGWTIRFPAYAKVAGANYELPQRIEATRESVRVRLLVDSWGAGTR